MCLTCKKQKNWYTFKWEESHTKKRKFAIRKANHESGQSGIRYLEEQENSRTGGLWHMEFQTELRTIEDAVKLVNKLEHYECKAQALIDDRMLDARSLMGLLEFGIGINIRIVVRSEINEMMKGELSAFMMA